MQATTNNQATGQTREVNLIRDGRSNAAAISVGAGFLRSSHRGESPR